MKKRLAIGQITDFPEGKAKVVHLEGASVVVKRVKDTFCAVENRCPHMGLPLGAGKIEGQVITCPFHGSKFDFCSGENLDWVTGVAGAKLPGWSRKLLAMGKTPSPVKSFLVLQEDGTLYIEL